MSLDDDEKHEKATSVKEGDKETLEYSLRVDHRDGRVPPAASDYSAGALNVAELYI